MSVDLFIFSQKLLFMDDIVRPGATNLRPKPEDCGVKIENLTAAWTGVLSLYRIFRFFWLFCNVWSQKRLIMLFEVYSTPGTLKSQIDGGPTK